MAAGRDIADSQTSGGADAREGSTAATGGAAVAQQGSGAGTGGSTTNIGFVEKAKKSTHFKLWGCIGVLVLIITTVLVLVQAFTLDWAGYIVGVVAVIVAIVPLLGGG